MSPLMISVLVFIAVQALLGALLFLFNDGSGKIAERLELLTGRRKKEDAATSILKKTAIDRDKRSWNPPIPRDCPTMS